MHPGKDKSALKPNPKENHAVKVEDASKVTTYTAGRMSPFGNQVADGDRLRGYFSSTRFIRGGRSMEI